MQLDARGFQPIILEVYEGTDCPICGRGHAFEIAQNFDTCARCGWVDDPSAYTEPEHPSATNTSSLVQAKAAWPRLLIERLESAPLSSFSISEVQADQSDFDFIIDGRPARDFFRAGRGKKTVFESWKNAAHWLGPLIDGSPASPLPPHSPTTPTGRVRLYVCPLCGGNDAEESVTADVSARENRVIWSRVGLETEHWANIPEGLMVDGYWLDLRNGPAGFAFDTAEYRRVLTEFAALQNRP
jgi:ribosomal protein L37AE/L43A